MTKRKKEEIALFRFGIIFPLLDPRCPNISFQSLIKEISGKEYDIPYSTKRSVSEETVRLWYNMYNTDKRIESLMPQDRKDTVQTRSFDLETTNYRQSTASHTVSETEALTLAHLRTRKKDLTLREYATGFYTKADPRGHRQRTEQRGYHYQEYYYINRQGLLDRFILPFHGSFKLKEITPRMIETLVLTIDRSNDLKNKTLYVYNTIMQSAKDDLLIQNNPAADLHSLADNCKKREAFDRYDLSKLFPEDDNKLIKVWGNSWWASYFMVLYETGWRPGEVSALHKDNIFPEKLALYTNQSVDFRTRRIKDRIKTTGKGFDYKIGFISERTLQLLLKQHNENGHIYCKEGRFISPDIANKHLHGVCSHLGIPYRSQYSFRHTFDSELFGNVSDEFRKLLMGHSGKSNYNYLHLRPEEAIERAANLRMNSNTI